MPDTIAPLPSASQNLPCARSSSVTDRSSSSRWRKVEKWWRVEESNLRCLPRGGGSTGRCTRRCANAPKKDARGPDEGIRSFTSGELVGHEGVEPSGDAALEAAAYASSANGPWRRVRESNPQPDGYGVAVFKTAGLPVSLTLRTPTDCEKGMSYDSSDRKDRLRSNG